ncbi:hypothetical protein HZB88_00425 [archaeon]|nr:hypothetical protein [archaeon]
MKMVSGKSVGIIGVTPPKEKMEGSLGFMLACELLRGNEEQAPRSLIGKLLLNRHDLEERPCPSELV